MSPDKEVQLRALIDEWRKAAADMHAYWNKFDAAPGYRDDEGRDWSESEAYAAEQHADEIESILNETI